MKIEIDVPVPDGWKYKSDNCTLIGKSFKELLIKGEIIFERVEPIDHELEEAKKLIGKWVYNTFHGNSAIRVERVYRDESDKIIWYANESSSVPSISWKHFPLPVWRCCAEDKHLLQPRKAYFVRSKKKDVWLLDTYDPVRGWEEVNHENKYEWLDEGGE